MATNGEEEDEVPPLTLAAIQDLGDAMSAIMLAEDHGVPVDGLETVEQIQQRLTRHLGLTHGSPKDKVVRKIRRQGEKDGFEREQLAAMIQRVRQVFPGGGSSGGGSQSLTMTGGQILMEDLLLKDGTTDDVRKDCDTRISSLKAKESVILVAGETSAGKSSVLNLLLGEEILPSHMLPCTSCITVLRYYHHRSARILHRNGEITRIPTLDKAGLEELQSRAYFSNNRKRGGGAEEESDSDVYERRREEHDIAEIQVFLPLELLQSGLVLVDTPGVGENEFLEKYLMDYIYSHQILGFLYIVMTDNALGMAEDRLVNLMSLIVKSQRNSPDVVKFDPRAAMFVCNRWDMVAESEREAVRTSYLRQLGKCWPEFDPGMAVFFSTRLAVEETRVNPGYITDDYQAMLLGLYRLYQVALDKRIKASYKWLGTVLQRCVHYLKTVVTRIDMGDRERHRRSEETHKKLKTLRNKAENVIAQLRSNVEDAIKDICVRVREYLKSPVCRMKLTQGWDKKGELPDMENAFVTWDWVKRRIDAAFEDRLTSMLEEWDKDEQSIPSLEKRLFRDAKLQLCDLETELSELENTAHDDNVSRVSRVSLLNYLCNSIDDFELDDLIDFNVPERMVHRVVRFVKKKSKQRNEKTKLKSFTANPGLVAEKRSDKLLDQMVKCKDDSLEEFVREMMLRPFSYIKKLEAKIPNMVRSNLTLLEKFEKEIVEQSKCRNEYLEMMEKIEGIRAELIQYGEGHFFANDFTEKDIDLVANQLPRPLLKKVSVSDLMKVSNTGVSAERDTSQPHGLWHAVYLGKVCREGCEGQFVSLKIYNSDMKIENSHQEVAKLRCLLHTDVCVAEFLGIYRHRSSPTPAYIFNGRLVSLARHLASRPAGAEEGAEAEELKILAEVLAGLQYIHSKQLVHMDLNKNTVTVDEKGNVKLTSACVPRPMATRPPSRVSDLVYIAPEVLAGHSLYNPKSDMYSFALLALEVRDLTYIAFSNYRTQSVDNFRTLNHQTLMEPHVKSSYFPPNVKKLLLRCFSSNMGDRPNAAEVSGVLQGRAPVLDRRITTPRHLWKSFATVKKR